MDPSHVAPHPPTAAFRSFVFIKEDVLSAVFYVGVPWRPPRKMTFFRTNSPVLQSNSARNRLPTGEGGMIHYLRGMMAMM